MSHFDTENKKRHEVCHHDDLRPIRRKVAVCGPRYPAGSECSHVSLMGTAASPEDLATACFRGGRTAAAAACHEQSVRAR